MKFIDVYAKAGLLAGFLFFVFFIFFYPLWGMGIVLLVSFFLFFKNNKKIDWEAFLLFFALGGWVYLIASISLAIIMR